VSPGAIGHPPSVAGELAEPAGHHGDPADRAVARERHRERAAALAELKPRERRDLYLHAAGYGYQGSRRTGCTR
jgi:hypothetical protein